MNKALNIERCRKLISIASTSKAIQVLIELCFKNFRDEAIMVSNRWEELNKQFISNIIEENNFAIERNKINQAILLLLAKIENFEKVSESYKVPEHN